jgi:hypothetical protein
MNIAFPVHRASDQGRENQCIRYAYIVSILLDTSCMIYCINLDTLLYILEVYAYAIDEYLLKCDGDETPCLSKNIVACVL